MALIEGTALLQLAYCGVPPIDLIARHLARETQVDRLLHRCGSKCARVGQTCAILLLNIPPIAVGKYISVGKAQLQYLISTVLERRFGNLLVNFRTLSLKS